ncbi:hypothetical protein Sjap_022453 [Stephania japonica]|uniref:Protein kinase domain-containing protein n=1 Tax=Stephania japonica TaxID=461633 RepID=A0AAP0EPF1_9MAGN
MGTHRSMEVVDCIRPGEVTVVVGDTWDELVPSNSPVVVEFWADWCGPCRMVHREIAEIVKEYAGRISCLMVNADEDIEVAEKYGINVVSVVLLFKNGEKRDSITELLKLNVRIRSRMEWSRVENIGTGAFAKIYLATPRTPNIEFPPLMAVKSAMPIHSSMLHQEKQILIDLSGCPQIIHCYGDDTSIENGEAIYNGFLELSPNGNLSNRIAKSLVSETDVRRYTRLILRGLHCIHKKGYVHCDIKPDNILIFPTQGGKTDVKITDFGLTKRVGCVEKNIILGAPMYLSPELIALNDLNPGCDIWALGCIVAEMVTGRTAWKCDTDAEARSLLYRIGFSEKLPEIPSELSEKGKDFLGKCWQRDCSKRWTAEMLLSHPFVAEENSYKSFKSVADERVLEPPKSALSVHNWSSSRDSLFCASRVVVGDLL